MNNLLRVSFRALNSSARRSCAKSIAPSSYYLNIEAATMATRSGTQQSPPEKKMAHFPRLDVQASESPGTAVTEIWWFHLLIHLADFRRVLWTGEHSQLVIMTSKPLCSLATICLSTRP